MKVALAFVLAFIVGVTLALWFTDARAEWQPRDAEFYRLDASPPKRVKKPRRPEVRAWRRVAPIQPRPAPVATRVEREPQCMPAVEMVGEQWATEDGAWTNAIKSWSQHVRFHAGELYGDFEHARDVRRLCVGSSVSGGSGIFKRCRVWARPCKPQIAE